MENDDVVSGDSFDQADFARQNASILSYNLNKTLEEREGSYDSNGTIKQAHLSVRGAIEQPNGRRIILKFNSKLQPVGDEAGLLSGVLGKLQENIVNQSKQVYTHTGGSKSLARQKEEELQLELQGRKVSKGKLWTLVHKTKDSSYIHEEARTIGAKETQRKLLKLQVELEVENLKRKAMGDEVVAEKKRQTIENALRYLFQRQGEELPPGISVGMNFVEGQSKK
ncbi:hypothetical protein Ahy_A03g012735 [Arachis hypogaea]|uniref:Uncharacterized protein n=1 Tax=Arachis hypogaea TaxID=3818 RepID=A0A445DU98_ARAHY|nr:hypothetical protein Ahy_A03g012735 [Arachis hypogaea]